jgi:Peptidase_C39 like family
VGPATAQIILDGCRIRAEEVDLADEMGTDEEGTDTIVYVSDALKNRLPQAHYKPVMMPHDPPTADEEEQLRKDLTRSIDAGFGVAMNWVAPPDNYPIAVPPSTISPHYNGGVVRHYVAAMGYSDTNGERTVWIADPGFWPYGYWCSFHQVASLIPDKGYAYATGDGPAGEGG